MNDIAERVLYVTSAATLVAIRVGRSQALIAGMPGVYGNADNKLRCNASYNTGWSLDSTKLAPIGEFTT